MFLRSLDVRGFKSFADRVTLDFTPGISVVVGPNGSGKSNLVDAITWVLGEQGPRALRGGSMADVIFAGSPNRSALGMAQVTLVVDNAEGLVPVPLSEIEISRAVYRSGESQYFIGGQAVRLLDIQELLAETGIGRALHTVVGQNQLEDVLTARPEERRQYIEEAAGIAKHRRRRERAERKLASVEQDVLRLQDVLAELARRLKPLRQQADMAKRHEALTGEAERLAVRLAAARLRALYAERDAGRDGWEEGLGRRRDAEARLAALDAELAELAGRRREAEDALAAAAAEAESAAGALSEAEARLRDAVRAEAEARARLAEAGGRGQRISLLEEDLARNEAAGAQIDRALQRRVAELEQAEAEHAAAARARNEAEARARALHEEAASRRAEADALQRSLDGYERERERIQRQLDEVAAWIAEAERERERLEEEVERLDATETPLSKEQARLERERTALTEEIAGLEEREARLDARLTGLEERRDALRETPGRRFLRERAGGRPGTLGDLVEAKPGFERAVAAALGPFADAVVERSEDAAVAAAEAAPGVTFAVAPGSERPATSADAARPILDVLRADPLVAPAVRALLARTYLAADAAEAVRGRRRDPEATFVTRAGTVFGPAFVRRAADEGLAVRAVEKEQRDLQRELEDVRAALARRRGALRALQGEATNVGARLDEADALITAAADRMGRIGSDLASLGREREVLVERLAALDEAAGAWREALAAVPPPPRETPALPPAPEPPLALRVDVESLRREHARIASDAARARTELEALRAEDPRELERVLHEAEAARARAEEAIDAGASAVDAARTHHGEAATAERAVRDAEADANRRWREVAAQLGRLRDDYEEVDQARRDMERRIDDAERVLREGHGREPAEAMAELDEADTVESLSRRSELVARRLALLGRVNLLAGEEFGALQERHDFLARELEDVKAARRELQEVIREVDRRIVETFDRAYRDVASAFEQLFAELFPGGEGRITLTDPEDPLRTGVDVEARPGRKRVKRLSLLSGGERALTALCFLFAIFRARPSPFYLLDEVEAALDDVNLHRFLQLVKGFARDSQVLLVTHQKRTMEIADVLYGVSMGGDGASRVVAQRMENLAPAASPAPAPAPAPR